LPTEAILVTGGAGFIGSALCRAFLDAGRRVVVFDNLSFGKRAHLPDHKALHFVEGDLRDAAAVRRLIQEHAPQVVCHLAALHFIPYCNAHPEETIEVNVAGTRALLDACRETRPARLVFASTAAVYPAAGSPFAEDHPTGPMDIYGASKLIGEELCRLFCLETGVSTGLARFFNAFGPNETNPHLIPDILAQLAEGDALRLGNLDPLRDYVHVDDLAAGVVALAARRGPGVEIFNIGSGEGRSVRDVVAACETALGRPLNLSQNPARIRPVDRAELVADTRKLQRETGWRAQVPFAEGMRRLLAEL
jgi:UDP-glucose 4-epimerase